MWKFIIVGLMAIAQASHVKYVMETDYKHTNISCVKHCFSGNN
jgi:hypothetical protein